MPVTKFELNKFYVMTPPGHNWDNYEGPFNTNEQALDHIRQFVNESRSYSPEMLGMVVIQVFASLQGRQSDTVKRDGVILNGKYVAERRDMNELLKEMEIKLAAIIESEGYQEMADGFNQALIMVKEYFKSKEKNE